VVAQGRAGGIGQPQDGDDKVAQGCHDSWARWRRGPGSGPRRSPCRVSGADKVLTPAELGAGERIRTAGLPFTRSEASSTMRATCTDDTGHRNSSQAEGPNSTTPGSVFRIWSIFRGRIRLQLFVNPGR
jgi:hypothetical protein